MNSIFRAIGLALVLVSTNAVAEDYKVGSLEITDAWSRATPKGAKTGAGYLTIHNTGAEADRLVAASSEAAGSVQVHEMTMDHGVMKMRPIADGLEIKPGETVELKPGGMHLIMSDLKRPLAPGEQIKGTLTFEKAGTVELNYAVRGIGSKSSTHEMGPMNHMGPMNMH